MSLNLPPFYLVGLAVRTAPEEAAQKIGPLWERLYAEEWLTKIPNRLNDTLYGLYTDYEGDFTKPYTALVGVQVSTLSSIPKGLVGMEIPAQNYTEFDASGELPQSVIDKWGEIWQTPMNRNYIADFEKYDGGEVSIYIGVK